MGPIVVLIFFVLGGVLSIVPPILGASMEPTVVLIFFILAAMFSIVPFGRIRMFLPQAWLRALWLRRALHEYPLYNPPHKVEERLLSKEKATENFDYFMRVREQRVAHFQDWLRRNFGVIITLDEKGVRALGRWGNRYAGLLLDEDPAGHPTDSYFTFHPPWTGENAGYNVIFDMGIVLGEAMIASCPKLRWDVDPISAILPRTARQRKREAGVSYQRPELTGFDDPVGTASPLHEVFSFAHQMSINMTTFDGINRYYTCPRFVRRNIREELLNAFNAVLRDYPAGDPYKLRGQMSQDDYLKFVDAVESEEEDRGDKLHQKG
jgi:hypothetical protein